ncbi:MAG: hypothetical protein RR066_04255 [Mucinivorans sp.]
MQKNDYNQRAQAAISTENMVGQISKVYGTSGQLVVKLWDTFSDDMAELLWVDIDSLATPLFVKSFTPQGQSKAIMVFEDFEDEKTATTLVGLKLFSELVEPGSDEEEEDEWGFLIGFALVDATTGKQGIITGYQHNELNPLLEVNFSGTEHLLPIDEELITKFDKGKRKITLTLAQGIFDL